MSSQENSKSRVQANEERKRSHASGTHADRRLKRLKTRQAAKTHAMKEHDERKFAY